MDKKLVGAIIGLVIVMFAAAISGVLPLAILIGIVAGVLTLALTREYQAAAVIGSVVFFTVSAIGIATMISPEWYRGLL